MSLDCWAECWTNTLNGANPLNEVGHADAGESYVMEMIHVFHLDNGQYVVVTESGCSCYESNGADLELHPTLAKAFDKYIEYKKSKDIPFSNLEFLEIKSQEKENESRLKNIDSKIAPKLED